MTHSSTSSHWYFTKEELIQAYGADYKAEVTARRTTVAFLQEAGIKLRQPQLTIATAIVFFHRFFVRHGLRDYDPYIIATTCLFLAGKVEETPKKLRDVILVTHRLRNKNAEDLKQDSKEFWELKELILSHERTVLQTIAFDLTIEHPYKFLLTYVKNIQGNRNLAQVAWNFVNDSLRTNLCLQYKPQFIASAAIYLASKFLKYTLAPDGKKAWWEVLDAKIDELEDISNQILDLYDSSPNLNTLGAAGEAGGYGSGSFFGPTTPPHPQLPAPTGHHTSSHHSHSRSTHSHHSSHHQYPPPPPSDPPPPPPPDHPPPPPPPSLPPPPPPSGPPPPPPSSAPPPPPPDGQSPLKPSNGLTRTPNAPATPTSSIPPPPRSSRSRSPSPRRGSPRRGSRSPRRYSRSPSRRSRSPSRRSRSPRRSSRSPRRSPRRSRSPTRRGGSRSPRRSRSRSPPRRRSSPYRHDRDGGRDRGGYYRRDNNNRYRY